MDTGACLYLNLKNMPNEGNTSWILLRSKRLNYSQLNNPLTSLLMEPELHFKDCVYIPTLHSASNMLRQEYMCILGSKWQPINIIIINNNNHNTTAITQAKELPKSHLSQSLSSR